MRRGIFNFPFTNSLWRNWTQAMKFPFGFQYPNYIFNAVLYLSKTSGWHMKAWGYISTHSFVTLSLNDQLHAKAALLLHKQSRVHWTEIGWDLRLAGRHWQRQKYQKPMGIEPWTNWRVQLSRFISNFILFGIISVLATFFVSYTLHGLR